MKTTILHHIVGTRLACALFLAALAPTLAHSATVTWDGSTDTTWTQPDTTSWTGSTFISGDTAQFLGAGAGNVTITGGGVTPGAVIVNSSANYTFTGGAIGNNGTTTLTKNGTGVLTLSNANTYTGLTTVTAGVLDIGAISSNAIANGSGILLGTVGNGTGILQGSGNFTRTLSGTGTPGAGQVAGQDGGFAARGGQLTVTFNNDSNFELQMNQGAFRFGSNFAFGSASADSKVVLTNRIDLNTTGSRVFTVTAGIGGAAATSAEFSGVIRENNGSGTGSITKNGNGMLILSNTANSFFGAIALNNGTLSIASIKNVGGGNSSAGAPTTVANGTITMSTNGPATLLYTGTGDTTDRVISLFANNNGSTLDQSGTGLLRFTSNLTVGLGTKTLTLQGSTAGTGEISGVIPNAVSLSLSVTKNGTGTWTLSGNNTYTGATTINGGTLQLDRNLALQNSALVTTGAGNLTLGSGITTPTFGGLSGATGNLATVISSGYNLVTALTLNPAAASSVTYGGVIANGAANMTLTKSGAGNQTLTGVNAYTGTTSVQNGRLILDVGDNRLPSTSSVVLGDAATTGRLVLGGSSVSNQTLTSLTTTGLGGSVVGGNSSSSTLRLNIASGSNTFAGTLGGAGTNENNLALTLSGPGTLLLTAAGNNTYSGLTNVIDSGVLDVGTISGGGLSANSGLLLGNSTAASGNIGILQGNGNFTRSLGSNATVNSTQVAGASGGFAARGGQLTVNLGGAGARIDLSQGSFQFGNNFVFGSSTADSKVVLVNPINLNSSAPGGQRFFTVNAGIGGAAATSAELQGVISDGSAANVVNKQGNGTLILSASNTYTGGTTIGAGTLQIGNGGTTGSISSTGNVSITAGATLAFNRSNSLTFANTISGNGSVNQIGSGATTLSGANTYTGNTTVSAGTLLINGSTSASSAINAASGATLGGNGTVGGSVTIAAGATLAPGNSPGILSTGNLSISGILSMEINGATVGSLYDQVNVTGTVTLVSGNTLTLALGYTPTNGTNFFLINNDGADAIVGTLNGYAQGDTFTLVSQQWQISYTGNSTGNSFTGGNDLVIQAIPEPSTWALLAFSLTMVMILRRRRSVR